MCTRFFCGLKLWRNVFIRAWMTCQSVIYTFQRRKNPLRFSYKRCLKQNFHKVRLTGSAFNPYARPDEMHTSSCSKYLTLEFYETELLSWGKSGKYRNKLPYELYFQLSLFTYSYMHVSELFEFIQSDVPVTLYYCCKINSEQYLKN